MLNGENSIKKYPGGLAAYVNDKTTQGFDMFSKMVEAGAPIGNIRTAFRKPDGSLWARETIKKWVGIYKEGSK